MYKKILVFFCIAIFCFFGSISSSDAIFDGSILSTTKIASGTTNGPSLVNEDLYGTSVANIGDLNKDGVADIAVGAIYKDASGPNRGQVFIHFMNTNGTIKSTAIINDTTVNGPTLADYDV